MRTPYGVGTGLAISTKDPNRRCVSLYNSGLLTMKKTRAEMKLYLALSITLSMDVYYVGTIYLLIGCPTAAESINFPAFHSVLNSSTEGSEIFV